MLRSLLSLLCLSLFVFSVSSDALAKPKHREHDNDTAEAIEAVAGVAQALISLSDRNTIKGYLRENHHPKCPPGLAKKNNGCLPPGIAKKYAMGKALPPGIAAKRLPDGLLGQLSPIAGYHYGMVDNDIVLISEATQKVMDAVTLLSAVK